jgi:protein O-GlcNAcase/histone acetyltransferase
MAKPSLEKSPYLQTIGNGLHPDIDVFWTGKLLSLAIRQFKSEFIGPKIVSRRLTVPHILSVNSILQRRVTIWDNLNANDYDQRRLCLGPFTGRPSSLSSRLSGMLINPNCEFELNFVPLNTLGQWFQTITINENQDQIDDDDDDENSGLQITQIYQVHKALDQALIDWLPEFNRTKSANDKVMSN